MADDQPTTPETTTPTKSTKAVVGAAITVVLAFLTSIQSAMPNGLTGEEWLTATISALVSAGLVFGGVYATTNRPK